ncbi:MAG: hypothetical protein JSR72_13125 [Proteobacteria bacterium]|nr:hypothetical protein [Pseudomonadota bacterium]
MRIPVITIALAAFAAVAAIKAPALAANGSPRNDLPQFDVKPSCNSATKAANDVDNAGGNLRPADRSADNCVQDEMNARSKLNDEWARFNISERQRCMRLATLGGLPSYVELLTCLEMAREAANISEDHPAAKTRPGQ